MYKYTHCISRYSNRLMHRHSNMLQDATSCTWISCKCVFLSCTTWLWISVLAWWLCAIPNGRDCIGSDFARNETIWRGTSLLKATILLPFFLIMTAVNIPSKVRLKGAVPAPLSQLIWEHKVPTITFMGFFCKDLEASKLLMATAELGSAIRLWQQQIPLATQSSSLHVV